MRWLFKKYPDLWYVFIAGILIFFGILLGSVGNIYGS